MIINYNNDVDYDYDYGNEIEENYINDESYLLNLKQLTEV